MSDATIFAQAAFLLGNPHKYDDVQAQYPAGAEGAMRVYETSIRARPKGRSLHFDGLIRRREAGALEQFIDDDAGEWNRK